MCGGGSAHRNADLDFGATPPGRSPIGILAEWKGRAASSHPAAEPELEQTHFGFAAISINQFPEYQTRSRVLSRKG